MAQKLAYLFVAEYQDGTFIEQTQEDQSKLRKDKSAFYDVLQKKGLIRFSLVGVDTTNTFTVDLRDGLFECNGVPFGVHDQMFEPKSLRIAYWREVQAIIRGTEVLDKRVNRYFMGWQTNERYRFHNGDFKNLIRVISIT